MENENYIPFGPEWRKDIMKIKKDDLITFWADSLKKLEQTESLQKLMVDISTWSDATFGEGQRNPAILHHLKKEVSELIEAIEKFQECGIQNMAYSVSEGNIKSAFYEYSDCFMLLLDSAYHFGIDADTLMKFTRQKLEINKKRVWGKPDSNGVVEHIRKEGEHGK